MEAAVCGKRAIALSFAFFNRNHDPLIIGGASRMAVRIVEYLAKNWSDDVELYTVNIPLLEGVDRPETRVIYTNMLDNKWSEGTSCFEAVDAEKAMSPEEAESILREGYVEEEEKGEGRKAHAYTHKKFKWAPNFQDVYGTVERSAPGNDGWAVQAGHVRYGALFRLMRFEKNTNLL